MLPKTHQNWYQQNYADLTAHGLWLRGQELNTAPLKTYFEKDFRVLFTRLSTYFDTGYSFTHQILYQVAQNTPGVFPDLAYLPPKSDAELFNKGQVPWLLGTQTKFGPEAFDVIGFSNSIVQELLNLVPFLKNSGIPLNKSERMKRADLPLILMGGANALYSSSIWTEEPPVDGIFVGENDQAIRKILMICRESKLKNISKEMTLQLLEAVPGFFQPDKLKGTKKNFIMNLNQSEALENGPVYYIEDQLGSSHLQISEGCPCFCSFCAESWDRKPYRERGAPQLKDVALRAKASMGLDSIDIYSFNFNMHSDFYQILWDLVPSFKSIGLKSQRFDLLAQDPQMIEFQHAIEKASITCGLEGVSPRLRKYLHKNLEDEQLHKSLNAIFKSRARELKVFLIATGLEQHQDFIALSDLIEHIKEIRDRNHAQTRIIFSMTPLVRFPWTPLEFENAYSMQHYAKVIKQAAHTVRIAGLEFRESADLPEYWMSQVLVRADDKRIYQAMLKTYEVTGFVYYRGISDEYQSDFERNLSEMGVNTEALLKGFTLEESAQKPWTKIETTVKREFLWEEVLRAREFTEIDYCLGREWAKAECFHCGGCPTRFHVKDIVLSKQKRNYNLMQFKDRITASRKSEAALDFLVEVGELGRGVPRKQVGVALARAMMLAEPKLTPYYRGFSKSFWVNENKPLWLTGADVITLLWNQNAVEFIRKQFENEIFLKKVAEQFGGWGVLQKISDQSWTTYPGTLHFDSPFEAKMDPLLKDLGLKYTLKKLSDGNYSYELIPASLKKTSLKS